MTDKRYDPFDENYQGPIPPVEASSVEGELELPKDSNKNARIIVIYILSMIVSNIIGAIVLISIPEILDDDTLFSTFNSVLNLTYYGALFLLYVILYRYFFRHQWNQFRKDKRFYFGAIGIGVAIMYVANIVSTLVMEILNITDTSINQQTLELLLDGPIFNAISLVIFAVFLAPVVEEIVFRKGIFGIMKNADYRVQILVSGLIFGFIHVLAGDYIQIIYYAMLGFALGYIYHYSKQNILVPIGAHMVMNLIATIFMFLL